MIRTLLRHPRWPIAALAFALAGAAAMLPAQTAPGRSRPEPATPGGPFKIAGVVVSSKTGAPLGRALVTIFDTANPRRRAATVTGADGHFEFDHLSAGKYSLQGERRGFLPTSYEQHGQFSTAIVTGPGFETQNLTLRLVPTALISGHIYDEAGEPVRKAQVQIYRVNHGLGVARVDPAGGAQSDDRGYFDLPASPGTYYVSADAQPWYAVHPRRSGSPNAGSAVQAVDPSLDV
ncbi:MAG TPA: carboxypeptidase-like regulatory domain-containing protein, partial [Terriglobia bacterium]|nr:carboxypeptidase-like regulatory domain-containing protein [Terriglobia bacterium]